MSSACREFRSLLEIKLTGRPSPDGLMELSWHEHLLACDACRRLLESEEALDALLASLPEPKLPPHLVERVVARLREAGSEDSRLDRLLDLDEVEAVPPMLARDVLARLKNDRRLDEVLEVYAVETPPDLAELVLERLDAERVAIDAQGARDHYGEQPANRVVFHRSWILAIAASLLALLAVWAAWPRGARDGAHDGVVRNSPGDGTPGAGDPLLTDEPEPELLAYLDVLEQWDLVTSKDIDVQLSALGPADEALLEDADPAATPIPERPADPQDPAADSPTKGH